MSRGGTVSLTSIETDVEGETMNLFQVDAIGSTGYSGGPVFLDGAPNNVIGIIITSGQSVNYAYPIDNKVLSLIMQLKGDHADRDPFRLSGSALQFISERDVSRAITIDTLSQESPATTQRTSFYSDTQKLEIQYIAHRRAFRIRSYIDKNYFLTEDNDNWLHFRKDTNHINSYWQIIPTGSSNNIFYKFINLGTGHAIYVDDNNDLITHSISTVFDLNSYHALFHLMVFSDKTQIEAVNVEIYPFFSNETNLVLQATPIPLINRAYSINIGTRDRETFNNRQKFRISQHPGDDGAFRIRSLSDASYLRATEASNTITISASPHGRPGDTSHLWDIIEVQPKRFVLVHRALGKVLSPVPINHENGSSVTLGQYRGFESQIWGLDIQEDPTSTRLNGRQVEIYARRNSNIVWDLRGGDATGGDVIVFNRNFQQNQRFRLKYNEQFDAYRIVSTIGSDSWYLSERGFSVWGYRNPADTNRGFYYWRFIEIGNDEFIIQNFHTLEYVRIDGGVANSGSNLSTTRTKDFSDGQVFRIRIIN
jgi:hypothetical protein